MRQGARPGRHTRRRFSLDASVRTAFLLVLCWALMPLAQGDEPGDLLSLLKVAYVYNFTRFVQWPALPQGQPFVIGVIGDPELEDRLRALEREGKQAAGRPIQVRGYASADAIGASQILFVGGNAEGQLQSIVRHTAGRPTLLVADTPGSARRGVAIELFRKPDVFRKKEFLRIRINPAGLEGRGLVVSAQLYDVAEVVR
jgi:hypothetical protein